MPFFDPNLAAAVVPADQARAFQLRRTTKSGAMKIGQILVKMPSVSSTPPVRW